MSTTTYSDLHIRLDTKTKNKAEKILNDLGVSPSSAINIFYRQVISHDGLPFRIVRTKSPVPNLGKMSDSELTMRLARAEQEAAAGQYRPADDVFRDILGDGDDKI